LKDFPSKRIEPVDGMAVTAEVWKESHDYHRLRERYHALLHHGPGIVTGLEVIASDPPDSSVFILPGIALDTQGQTIVLPEPTAFDVGQSRGLLYLLLTYGESAPLAGDSEEGPRYIHAQFGIEARSELPDTPYVELARIRRQDRDAPIANAQDAAHPAADKIDQRFRRQAGVTPQEAVTLAVCYTGAGSGTGHGQGASHLARALRHAEQQVWLDDGVPLAEGLEAYTLVYLVGQDAFELDRDEMNALYAYLQAGGTILFESCRQATEGTDPPADAAFLDLLASMGVELETLPPDHRLLVEPFLFAAPPPGFETEGTPEILVGGGVFLSTFDYGCLWRGERRGGSASREEIRTAMEWGTNLLAYAAARRRQANAGSESG
jgi:hypothetical protein